MQLRHTFARWAVPIRAAGLLSVLLASACAAATTLTFDEVRSASAGNPVIPTVSGFDVPLDYGDRVTGSVVNVPGGQFTYGQSGEGFTPNVNIDIDSGSASPTGAGVGLWRSGYGDLGNVLFANNSSSFLALRLSADAGYQVGLFGFDLAGYPGTDYLIRGISVLADGASTLFSQADVLVQGDADGPQRSSFSFADGLFGSELLLTIDFGNLPSGQHDNIGLDNLRFGQLAPVVGPPGSDPITPVPEPGTWALMGSGLVALGLMRRRSRRAP